MEIKINKIVPDMPNDEYHATPDLTRSQIVNLLEDQAIWKHNKDHHEETKALVYGTQFHELTLEGIEPHEIKGRITERDIEQIRGMAAVAKHMLPSEGAREISYFFTIDGIHCKCRPDLILDDTVYDLKSTTKPLSKFHWTIRNYRYDIQSVFYKLGTGAKHFKFVVVEKKAPYFGKIFEIEDESYAFNDVKDALTIYQEAQLIGVENIVPWDEEVHMI